MAPYIILSQVIGPVRSRTILTPRGAYSTAAMWRTTIAIPVPPGIHLHTRKVKHFRVICLVQGHNIDTTMSHNVPALKGEEHDISLKILHLASLELEQQAATLAKLRV